MVPYKWGLLGVEKLGSSRRSRTLELGAAVRCFNDLALPGLGGVWFCKPLLWACLGIKVAQLTGQQNIPVANAIEALSCWLAFTKNGWISDPRLRGRDKLRGKEDLSYKRVSKSSFYVTQPMRQQTGEPLRALGLVGRTGSRFNSFSLSTEGENFLNFSTSSYRPAKKQVVAFLADWVRGGTSNVTSPKLYELLSPLTPLSKEAREILSNRFDLSVGAEDMGERRRSARKWVTELKMNGSVDRANEWGNRPKQLSEAHWLDLKVGTWFFNVRDAAILLLESLEAVLASRKVPQISLSEHFEEIDLPINNLKEASRTFLDEEYDPSPEGLASAFCRECKDEDRAILIKKLVGRDGRVLRLIDNKIVPGLAFDPGANKKDEEEEEKNKEDVEPSENLSDKGPMWPRGISYRIPNLFWFNLDLEGNIEDWLTKEED